MNIRFTVLLVLLLVVLVLLPALSHNAWGMTMLAAGYGGLLVASVLALGEGRTVRALAIALALPAFALDVRDLLAAAPHPSVAGMVFDASFLVFVGGVLLSHIRAREEVDVDLLLGGTCVYLLLGIFFAHLFAIMELVRPGSFLEAGRPFGQEASLPQIAHFVKLTYFSFVSLTTLGYGDIQPVLPLARAVASLEAVVGQVYLAVLIGTLVGQRVARRGAVFGAR